MSKNYPEAEHVKHTKIITEAEIQDLVETGKENVKNDVVDEVVNYDSTEYSIHTLANTVDQTYGSEQILLTISNNGNNMCTTYLNDGGCKVIQSYKQ